MRLATDYRAFARRALSGHWGRAIGVAVVASMLSAGYSVSSSSRFNIGPNEYAGSYRFGSSYAAYTQPSPWLVLLLSVLGIALSLIGGAIIVGRSRFDLRLAAQEDPPFSTLFSAFDRFWQAFALNLLMTLFILLWSLLFVIPGIIAAYRYALAPYLMAENPDMGPLEAIGESKRLMAGNKGRLFCLHMSFIGWFFLCFLTLGIGFLWFVPYVDTAMGAFYLDMTGQEARLTGQVNAV